MSKALASGTGEARFTIDLPVSPHRAWHALTGSIDDWWPADYRAHAAGSRMQLALTLGGPLTETSAEGNGVLWYQVIALDAPRSLVMSGFVAPPFGGPATSLLRLSVLGDSASRCALEVHDSLLGVADEKAVAAGWRAIFGGLERLLARDA